MAELLKQNSSSDRKRSTYLQTISGVFGAIGEQVRRMREDWQDHHARWNSPQGVNRRNHPYR